LVEKNQPPFAYSLLVIDREGAVRKEKTYFGLDAAENFISTVLDLADELLPQLSPGVPMEDLSEEERAAAAGVNTCYLCNIPFKRGTKKCLDHDHLTGKVLGVAHDWCNLSRRETHTLSCFAHNFSGYDSHFLIRALNKNPRIRSMTAIPLNTQRFKAITVNHRVKFLDSCQFLLDSLSNLTDTLVKSGCSFKILDQMGQTEREKRLLLRKGVYPYSFATSISALQLATSLPPRESFDSELTGEACSEADYDHAKEVWETFRVKDMLEYTGLYVRSDVYQLAEVIYDFRNLVWNNFGLDVCQYLSLPHLAKDIMLKTTGTEIELIADQEMSDMLQKGIRGGLSFVNVRHAEKISPADLPAAPAAPAAAAADPLAAAADSSGAKPAAKPKSMLYVDANNLYGYAMCLPLPQRDFRWMEPEEVAQFDPLRDISREAGPGYILEVDLEYPEHLHLAHNSLPLAPEPMDLGWQDLSFYSQECLRAMGGGTHNYKSRKLSSTFRKR
jgi:hypothetical protein